MQKLFEIVVQQLTRFFGIKHVAIFKIVPSDVELSLAYSSGFKEESVHRLERLMPEQGVLRRLLDTRIPQIVNDISETEKTLYFLGKNEGLSSMIAVPIFAAEKPWGVLTAFSQEASRFREEDGKIVSLFAGQTGQLLQVFAQHLR
ncbi:MAG: GAF domain-containing protein, partial [candidate division Zixibacteria bacterium]|nr:GAF domain-containing protein [candidate division Zixibacteria bacterium]